MVFVTLSFVCRVEAILEAEFTSFAVNVRAFLFIAARAHNIIGAQLRHALGNLLRLATRVWVHSPGVGQGLY